MNIESVIKNLWSHHPWSSWRTSHITSSDGELRLYSWGQIRVQCLLCFCHIGDLRSNFTLLYDLCICKWINGHPRSSIKIYCLNKPWTWKHSKEARIRKFGLWIEESAQRFASFFPCSLHLKLKWFPIWTKNLHCQNVNILPLDIIIIHFKEVYGLTNKQIHWFNRNNV